MNKPFKRYGAIAGGLLLPALAVATPILLPMARSARTLDAADLRPGVVSDASSNVVYLTSPQGGVEAVSSSTGRLIWSSSEAAVPLAWSPEGLLAQAEPVASAGELPLVVLDPSSGRSNRSVRIDLPDDVWATVDAGLSATFEAHAVVRQGETFLGWRHTKRVVQGEAPQPGEILQSEQVGAFHLDLATGRPESVDPAVLDQAPPLPAAVRQWVGRGDASTLPAASGEVIAATRREGDRLVLMRWSRLGEALPEIEISSGPYLHEIRSADRRHLLVVDRAARGDRDEYGWSVFSLETGAQLGQFRNEQSHAWFVVHQSQLIYVAHPVAHRLGGEMVQEPLRLRAVRLANGAQAWERPLRDRSYRGAFPP